MIQSKKIQHRLKTIKSSIDSVNSCYQDSISDHIIDGGMDYEKSYYLHDKNTLDLIKRCDKLKQLREDKLFDSIFNFSQIFFSIKEYLGKEFPLKHQIVEDFFSNEKLGSINRKKLSNDLKHNPENDLVYGTGKVKEETIHEPRKIIHNMYFKTTYFYSGIDSVELCNTLYNDLVTFLNDNF